MRILHILDHSLPLHSGYCFRTRAIMKAQLAHGHDCRAVTGVRQQGNGAAVASDCESVDDLTFYRTMRECSGPSPLREWREVGALAERIVEVVRAWRPDVLHAHSPALNGLAALRASQRSGLPLLYEIRAFWEDAAVGNGTGQEGSAKYWLTRQLENHVVSGSDAVVVICDGLRDDLIARGVDPAKITVSPNGVDMELFGQLAPREAALAQQLGISDRPVLGFIGSFYDYEGLDDLIAAMPAIRAAHGDVQLLLIGGGPMHDPLYAQAQSSPARAAIHMPGRVPHAEVERYYALTDILVYPRKSMRLTELVTPLKPLEAMAQGRLVAASDVGGHRELIADGETGALFRANDPADLARVVGQLLNARAIWPDRLAKARQFVREHRNWSANILRYDPVYQKLVDSRHIGKAA